MIFLGLPSDSFTVFAPRSLQWDRCQRAESCCRPLRRLPALPGCPLSSGSGVGGGWWCPSLSWHGDGGPLVPVRRVRRLTERQQSQDAGWDIDRLEPEGSCRIETHCQRLCYHQRLPASEGGREGSGVWWWWGGGEVKV